MFEVCSRYVRAHSEAPGEKHPVHLAAERPARGDRLQSAAEDQVWGNFSRAGKVRRTRQPHMSWRELRHDRKVTGKSALQPRPAKKAANHGDLCNLASATFATSGAHRTHRTCSSPQRGRPDL